MHPLLFVPSYVLENVGVVLVLDLGGDQAVLEHLHLILHRGVLALGGFKIERKKGRKKPTRERKRERGREGKRARERERKREREREEGERGARRRDEIKRIDRGRERERV